MTSSLSILFFELRNLPQTDREVFFFLSVHGREWENRVPCATRASHGGSPSPPGAFPKGRRSGHERSSTGSESRWQIGGSHSNLSQQEETTRRLCPGPPERVLPLASASRRMLAGNAWKQRVCLGHTCRTLGRPEKIKFSMFRTREETGVGRETGGGFFGTV